MTRENRTCLYIPRDRSTFVPGRGHRAALVTENKPGYDLTSLFFADDFEVAQRAVAEENAKRGVSTDDAFWIVTSSMKAQNLLMAAVSPPCWGCGEPLARPVRIRGFCDNCVSRDVMPPLLALFYRLGESIVNKARNSPHKDSERVVGEILQNNLTHVNVLEAVLTAARHLGVIRPERAWSPGERVDGFPGDAVERADAIAAALALSRDAAVILVSELRNALVPITLGGDESSAKAAERLLLLADALARGVE